MFQNIVDSGEVEIESDVTCLVGKNEAGKTAFLKALYRLNPIYGGPESTFTARDDYPRWRWNKDRKAGTVDETEVIAGTFELEDSDRDALGEHFQTAVPGKRVHISRNYRNEVRWGFEVDESAFVRHVAGILPNAHPSTSSAKKAKSLQALHEVLASRVSAAGKEGDATEGSGEAGGEGSDESQPDVQISDQILKLIEGLMSEESLRERISGLLEPRVPKFFYFDEYSKLPGVIKLEDILGTSRSKLNHPKRTARALLELAGAEGEELKAEDYEHRTAELEAAANEISSQLFEYWTQNQQLRVDFDVEKIIEPDDEDIPRVVAHHLQVRLHDNLHHVTLNFGTRSSGFQWFFSFIAAFSEFEGYPSPVVVLLDEPALNLHAHAQADFLRFINERLASMHQVLYSTHSPFMIEATKLRRVRVVEDAPGEGASVSSDVFTTDPDTMFPLQAALGYDLAQNLFVGQNNLVVEGTSDLVFLRELSAQLERLDRDHLDPEVWTIVPVGGANKVPTFVALLGARTNLSVTVLLDSDTRISQQITDLISKNVLTQERLVTVGQAKGDAKKADIEDLFEPQEYLKLYNEAFQANLTPSKLKGKEGEPILKRIAQTKGADFDHGRPAEAMLRDPSFVVDLSEETLARFENLARIINATIQ